MSTGRALAAAALALALAGCDQVGDRAPTSPPPTVAPTSTATIGLAPTTWQLGVRLGAFCSPVGALGVTAAGDMAACAVPVAGGQARWVRSYPGTTVP